MPGALPSSRVLAAALVVLVAATFAPVLSFDLVYDDHLVLADNGFLRTRGDLLALFDGRAARAGVPDAFRPVSVIFDLLTVRLFGLAPVAHHAVSLLLAALASVLAFAWLLRRGADSAEAFAAAALFSVAAVHAEVVAVVSFREDLLAFVLAMGAALAAERRGPASRLAATGLFFLACQAKMSVAPLALVVALARLGPVGCRTGRAEAAKVGAALGAGVVLALSARWLGAGTLAGQGADGRLLAHTHGRAAALAAGIEAAGMGLVRLAVPLGLSPDHPDVPATWSAPAPWLLAAGFLAALLWLSGAAARGRVPAAAFVLGGLSLAFLPVLQIVPLRNVEAERYLFVPSFVFAVGVARLLAAWVRRRPGLGPRVALPAAAYLVVQGAAAQAHARDYRSDRRMWAVAAARSPGSARAQALRALGDLAEAERRRSNEEPVPPWLLARAAAGCRAARRLDPHEGLAYLCTGRLHVYERRWRAAYRAFRRALDAGLSRADRAVAAAAHVSLDLDEATRREATALLARYVETHPYAAGAAAAQGRILQRLGRVDEALAALRRARRLAPDRWDVVVWSIELALDVGDTRAAETLLTREYEALVARAPQAVRATLWRRLRLARTLRLDTEDPRFRHGVLPP